MLDPFDVRAGQIDLVDDRDDRQVVGHGEMHVGDRLRFHPLTRIHQEHGAFAGREAPRDLIGEVNMTRRIDEVK